MSSPKPEGSVIEHIETEKARTEGNLQLREKLKRYVTAKKDHQ